MTVKKHLALGETYRNRLKNIDYEQEVGKRSLTLILLAISLMLAVHIGKILAGLQGKESYPELFEQALEPIEALFNLSMLGFKMLAFGAVFLLLASVCWWLWGQFVDVEGPLRRAATVWVTTWAILPAVMLIIALIYALVAQTGEFFKFVQEASQYSTEKNLTLIWEGIKTFPLDWARETLLPSIAIGYVVSYRRNEFELTKTRKRLLVGGVVVLLVAPAGLSAAEIGGAPAPDKATPAAFDDGRFGPYLEESVKVTEANPGIVVQSANPSPKVEFETDYLPKATHYAPSVFDVKQFVIQTESGSKKVHGWYPLVLNNGSRFNKTNIINWGFAGVEEAEGESYAEVDSGISQNHWTVKMENVDSLWIYVDVVRDGEVHRYVVKLDRPDEGHAA